MTITGPVTQVVWVSEDGREHDLSDYLVLDRRPQLAPDRRPRLAVEQARQAWLTDQDVAARYAGSLRNLIRVTNPRSTA
jgi:hypothetical protein